MHFHLGQIDQSVGAYVRAVEHLKSICMAANATPTFIDLGGGLPTVEDRRWAAAIAGLQEAIGRTADLFPEVTAVWLENGRCLTTSSTVLAVRVLDIKERPECRYLVCDGGRTNHALAADIRPHPVVPLRDRSGSPRLTTVCGPTCMTDDRLARVELPEDLAVDDVLIWMEAGAYHLPWETRFSHGLCAVVWCGADGRPTIARERESARAANDLWTPVAHHRHV